MKKLLYFSAAALTSLFAASCASDDVPEINADGMTSFQVQLPEGLDTRTFGDGNSATQLYVAIYDAGAAADATPLFSNFPGGALNGMEVTTFTGRVATVKVNLVKNKQYNIVLWAQNAVMSATATENAFNYTPTARTIQVNYGMLVCNNENADAFYSYETYTSTPTATKTFTLYRPFAQINIGTDDLTAAANAGMKVTEAGMKVTNVANVLNLATGTATGDETVNYATKALPTSTDGAFPVETYSYLTMGYVLVPGDKTAKGTTNVSLNVNGQPQNPFATYPNVPVQANFRTNIYGSLLTNPEVFNVTIEPAFNTPANNVGSWDGTTLKKPAIDKTAKSMEIYTPDELAWLADQLNNANNEYASYAINLNRDLDLNGKTWTPIGNRTNYTGEFNGNNHTIKNLTGNAGLFKNVGEGANIHDLNFENVNLNNTSYYTGALAGSVTSATVYNVKVNDGSINGGSDVGGVIGYLSGNSTVSNCDNAATVTSSGRYCGGIIGQITSRNENTTVSNCHNTGKITNTGSGYTGGVVGLSNAKIQNCSNTADVTATATGKIESVGGIAGEQRNFGEITGCTNSGNVSKPNTTNDSYGTGGIVGWVRYYYAFSDPRGLISVNDNTNEGSVIGATGCGGIVGMFYNYGFCNNNTNNAPKISSNKIFVAGIIGGSQYPTSAANLILDYKNPATKLVVKGNTTTTPMTAITGGCSNILMYDNGPANSDVSDNNVPQ